MHINENVSGDFEIFVLENRAIIQKYKTSKNNRKIEKSQDSKTLLLSKIKAYQAIPD